MTLAQLKYIITVAESSSMNQAARKLYISQPSLSVAIKELEKEIGTEIFKRSNKGAILTPEGEDFLSYAKQIVEQYSLMEAKFINKGDYKRKFSVSMQHYTFAVNAFMETVKQFGMDEFEFSVYETTTANVIADVRDYKSEIGILYINDYNRKVFEKIFREDKLEFHEIMDCSIYVYMAKSNPLAKKKIITLEELQDYPRLIFDQGSENSFYFAEEVLSTYEYKKEIKVNDRATILNFMVGMDGYTLCSGIICEDLNGTNFCAVKLDTDEKMTIGYVVKKGFPLSTIGEKYVEEISKYKDKVLE